MHLQSFRYLNFIEPGKFVLKTPQTNTQLLQHLDLRSLSQVINGKLGALNIQQYTYTTYLIYCEQMKMP